MNRSAVLILATLLLASLASAHGAPDPRDMETRVLHDHNDDCGGDAGTGIGHTCGSGHDLIALDMREAWVPGEGDSLVMRLLMSEGSGSMQDTISFKADGKTHRFSIKTSDDSRFTSSDCDTGSKEVVEAANGRFAIECTVSLSDLGLSVGDRLSDFSVQATQGGDDGDAMPGSNGGPAYSQGDDKTNYVRPRMDLAGPVQYADVEVDEPSVMLEPGAEKLVVVQVDNALGDQAQSFRVEVDGAQGVRARFHDPGATSGGYSATYDMDLPKDGENFVHLALDQAEAGASGTLTLTITSDAGGRNVATVSYGVGTPPPDTSGTSTPPPSDGEDSPGVGLWLLVGALMALVAVRRRG